jgi:hypothetical protein
MSDYVYVIAGVADVQIACIPQQPRRRLLFRPGLAGPGKDKFYRRRAFPGYFIQPAIHRNPRRGTFDFVPRQGLILRNSADSQDVECVPHRAGIVTPSGLNLFPIRSRNRRGPDAPGGIVKFTCSTPATNPGAPPA